ncbi:MAG: DMT family transporter [Gammaproteobacteria bacterium]|nr:DMT family transporter [Gammaproteobacteria bacterium]
MRILLAYIAVVLIWSTTPLAIKWSTEGAGFIFAIFARMFIGAMLALLLLLLNYKRLPLTGQACHAYFASGLAIFGAMMPVYWGAQYISSGLISVIFGLTPIITALLAAYFLGEQSLGLMKISGALLGLSGLSIIFFEQISFGDYAVWGILAVLLSVVLHSVSAIWIKRIDSGLPALVVTTGGLLFALPLFFLVYVLYADPLPGVLSLRAIWSIVYLGVMGSLVGFVSYYYLLANLQASTVALITLLTPVTALFLGFWFNHELLSAYIFSGTACVLFGLVLHQWGARIKRVIC